MRKLIFALASFGFCALAEAIPITVTSVTSNGGTNNAPSLIVDGSVPPEWTGWTAASNVWWIGGTPILTMTFDQVYNLQDVLLSVDNNDSYRVEISLNNSTWSTLFNISSGYGEVGSGMDTMSSLVGDDEYIAGIDFAATQARYARIFATGGDNYYSVGELAFQGSTLSPIPEPTSLALLGLGLTGLALARRRARD